MIYFDLFQAFFKIGLFGFGGGLGIIQLIYDNIQQFSSTTRDEFANIVAIAQATPGPVAINTATYIGYETEGLLGSLVATLGVVIPAFIIIGTVGSIIEKNKDSRYITGAIEGLKPATVAMVASAAITVGAPSFITDRPLGVNIGVLSDILPQGIDLISIILCIITVLLIGKLKVDPIKVLVAMGVAGAVMGV